MDTDEKKIYLVDSGLSFNLPFPLMLRPQRGVQLYITMDFSHRLSDSSPPFRVRELRSHFP
jgi:phospholipase A2